MNKFITICSLTFVSWLFAGIAYSEEWNVNPGMWETTSKMEVKGVPPEMAAMMQRQPMVEKECVKDKNYNFKMDQDAQGCTFNQKRHSSKKLSWDISCSAESGNAKGKGEANFNGNTVSGWFEMNMQGPSGPMTMRHTFEGKRIGAC